ncbi:MAG: UMP kinase [Gammaproteobacteria bacterium]|nr:MAG: UMP kinase [Gammaproteobacteria bacterium]RKZ43921.1 MAG: UMP kinase [Gammaproteobacteria bacterium]RKZ74359.1 MAG: UMP kinase [Gammaproteobacteria bacterium]
MFEVSSAYRRVLLKLSGEVLMGGANFGIEAQTLSRIASELHKTVQLGVQLGVVIGGGNIFRGSGLTASGIDRVSADYMGMLATVMNGLAMQDALQKIGVDARVMSAIRMNTICEHYTRSLANSHLEKGRITIFVAGTGNPFFTTDSAASLRAIELDADLMIKATKVDGVYDSDPVTNPRAKRFSQLSYNQVIHLELNVMDTTAVVLCRDNQMPLRVINISKVGTLARAIAGFDEGTLIVNEEDKIKGNDHE